jgi:hypothetical protein
MLPLRLLPTLFLAASAVASTCYSPEPRDGARAEQHQSALAPGDPMPADNVLVSVVNFNINPGELKTVAHGLRQAGAAAAPNMVLFDRKVPLTVTAVDATNVTIQNNDPGGGWNVSMRSSREYSTVADAAALTAFLDKGIDWTFGITFAASGYDHELQPYPSTTPGAGGDNVNVIGGQGAPGNGVVSGGLGGGTGVTGGRGGAGSATHSGGGGGDVVLLGGRGGADGGADGGAGGAVSIAGGEGRGTKDGGNVDLNAGFASGTGRNGVLRFGRIDTRGLSFPPVNPAGEYPTGLYVRRIQIPDGATGNTDVVVGPSEEITDVVVRKLGGAGGAGDTIQVQTGAGVAITDAMSLNGKNAGDLVRPASVSAASSVIPAAGTIRIHRVKAAGDVSCDVQIFSQPK